MIITKTQQIKKLESDIEKLNHEIQISDMIIFHQSEVIDTLEEKVKYQKKEIITLLKRIKKK